MDPSAGRRSLAALVFCAQAQATEIHPVAGAPDTGDPADGVCSLRDAIAAANETAPVPDCPAGSGLDTIVLSAGTYDLTLAGSAEDANTTGDLDVLGQVVIDGAGAGSTTIDAHGIDRIFDIYGGISATISGVKVMNGRAPNGANSTTSVGDPGEAGGAIRAGGDPTRSRRSPSPTRRSSRTGRVPAELRAP